ncbi:MAG: tetratricopeptide repeat protein [Thermoplasmata archaeon]|nr:tetratricopeptide repeat protein [Thermoplasmata archaeon]
MKSGMISITGGIELLLDEVSPLFKANTLVNAGVTLMEDGRFDKAVTCLDEALGYTADIWYFKGTSLYEMKKYKGALKCYGTALELNPKHSGSKMGKGVTLHYLGKYKQAIAIYNAIIAEGGKVAVAWFNKACTFCMMGKDEETFESLRKSNELDPTNTSIHLETDESFDGIRSTPKFKKLVEELRGHAECRMPGKQNLNYIG